VCYARALKGDRIELGNNGLISGAFSSDTTLSTPVAINKGGTGQTTAQAALDALAAASGSLVQGDIFIVDSSGNVVRLARGSDNQTLVMDGNNPNWETASGGNATTVQTYMSSTFSSSSTSDVDVTGFTQSKPNVSGGKCLTIFNFVVAIGTVGNAMVFSIDDNGTITSLLTYETPANKQGATVQEISTANGNTVKLVFRVSGGSACSIPVGSGDAPNVGSFAV